MTEPTNIPAQPQPSKTRLLNAALHSIRQKGYAATTVDDICREAGVTKGSFFHHFKSKDYLALAAIEYWEQMTGGLFASAPYHQAADPVDRPVLLPRDRHWGRTGPAASRAPRQYRAVRDRGQPAGHAGGHWRGDDPRGSLDGG